VKKTRVFLIFVLTVACITTNLKASWEDITFTENGVIQECDQYVQVFVHGTSPDITTIEMTGGEVGGLFIYGYSVVNISGGTVSGQFYSFHPENNDGDDLFLCPPEFCVNVFDHSMVNISSGSIDSLQCEDWGTVNITGGDLSLAFSNHSTVNISGGSVRFGRVKFLYLWPEENCSHLYLSGGQILGGVLLESNATMEVYGYGFAYDPNGGDPNNPKFSNGGRLTGFWRDGMAFSIDFQDLANHSYDNVILHEIPQADIASVRIEEAITEKREALAKVDAALEKERKAYNALEEMLESGDYGDLKKGDVIKAMQKIRSAIQHEKQSKKALQKSIGKLENALAVLDREPPADEPVEE